MKTPTPSASRLECQPPASDYVLRFDALSGAGRGLVFPCDAKGRVDLDALSEPARHNYFYARTLMGREFAFPVVREAAAMGGVSRGLIRDAHAVVKQCHLNGPRRTAGVPAG